MKVKVRYETEFEAKTHGLPGHYLVVDGPDGAGKGPILEALVEEAAKHGLERVFDCDSYEEKHNNLPDFDIDYNLDKKTGELVPNPCYVNLDEYDIIRVSEPNFSMGATRFEVIKDFTQETLAINPWRKYRALETTEHYSSERRVKLARVILPALKRGKLVLSSRSITSTPGYQVVQATMDGEVLTENEIYLLPGNRFAAQHLPDKLLIPTGVTEDELMGRIDGRMKHDDCKFEKGEMQAALIKRYSDPQYQRFFALSGVEIYEVNTGESVVHTKGQAHRIFMHNVLPHIQWDLLNIKKPEA